MMATSAPKPDEDLSCPICLGSGELCTVCEKTTFLCDCEERQQRAFCGMCQGTGEQ